MEYHPKMQGITFEECCEEEEGEGNEGIDDETDIEGDEDEEDDEVVGEMTAATKTVMIILNFTLNVN